MKRSTFLCIWAGISLACTLAATPLGTAFTYQGHLAEGAHPASGSYDLRSALFDAPYGGSQVGRIGTNLNVLVADGLFTAVLDFGEAYDGTALWLELSVRTNGGGAFVLLTPRQALTPMPQAVFAATAATALVSSNFSGVLPDGQLSTNVARLNAGAAFSGPVSFAPPAGAPFAVGTTNKVALLNADLLDGFESFAFWKTGGNKGTTAGVDALGTTDDQALELKVNQQRALRLEPAAGAPNLIGGAATNQVEPGTSGAVIGGGAGHYIGSQASFSIIGGGENNIIEAATDGTLAADRVTVGGGAWNGASGSYATLAGGYGNDIWAEAATVSGGLTNKVYGSAHYATVAGGRGNIIDQDSRDGVIGGGRQNLVDLGAYGATIGGGEVHYIERWADNATVGGGYGNQILSNAYSATIGGGDSNLVDTNSALGVIAGGALNTIERNALGGTVSGGVANTVGANAWFATVPGGSNNLAAGRYSLAAGRHAQALHEGAFVWADAQNTNFASTNINQFSVRCTGGARLVTAINAAGVPTAGVRLASGAGTWATLSDRNAKDQIEPVDPREVLEKLARMPMATWHYQSEATGVRHLGPMAQDFAAAFGLGEDDTHITTVDADGVALASIQGMWQVVCERESELAALRAQNADLAARLAALEKAVAALQAAGR